MIDGQQTDTRKGRKAIASLVTPLGEGGIGKILVSGWNALGVAGKVFQGKGIANLTEAVSQRLYYGHIEERGQKIDEVIVHVIKQEDSFTGEDVVEINCHGGIRVLMRIYECMQSAGAEGAPWNSLVSQSFEHARIDFVQREALQEIIHARTRLGVKVLLDQYAGALSGVLKQGLEIIEEIGHFFRKGEICHNDTCVSFLTKLVRGLLETASFGMALTMPQVLVILGKPNVGKSTLINAILGEERMLVHHEPGTTRDYISEFVSVDGIPFELVDTAGIREAGDELEALSIDITREQLQRSDKVIVVFDNTRPFDKEDEGILSALDLWLMSKTAGDAPQREHTHAIIPVINKCDLPAILDKRRVESALQRPLCFLSALNKDGFDALNKRLTGEFDTAYKPMRPVVFNKRQYQLFAKADSLVKKGKEYLIIKHKTDEALYIIDGLKKIFTACLRGQE